MKQPETCEISQTAACGKVDELAMLVRQLVHSLRKASPGNDLADRALDYLKRHGLAGTFLRGNSAFVPEDVPVGVNPSKAPEAVGTLPSASQPKNVPAQQGPVAWRIRHRSEPGMFGHYPWSFTERIHGGMQAHYEYEPLYAAQPAEALEKAAKYDRLLPYLCKTCGGYGLVDRRCLVDPLGAEPCPDCNAAPQALTAHRDAAFEAVRKKFCKLQRYSFLLDDKGNVRRTPDYSGNWVEFEAVHTLFEPAAVDAAIAAQPAQGGD